MVKHEFSSGWWCIVAMCSPANLEYSFWFLPAWVSISVTAQLSNEKCFRASLKTKMSFKFLSMVKNHTRLIHLLIQSARRSPSKVWLQPNLNVALGLTSYFLCFRFIFTTTCSSVFFYCIDFSCVFKIHFLKIHCLTVSVSTFHKQHQFVFVTESGT